MREDLMCAWEFFFRGLLGGEGGRDEGRREGGDGRREGEKGGGEGRGEKGERDVRACRRLLRRRVGRGLFCRPGITRKL